MDICGKKLLFVIGAPKCGTSSLVNWLGQHEGIFVPAVKEPGYFRDNADSYVIDAHHPESKPKISESSAMVNLGSYLALFDSASPEQWLVDGSTDYLASEVTARRLHALRASNTVRVICVLRDPIERAFSEHRHCIRDGNETLFFRGSIEAEEERIERGFQPLFFHVRRSRFYADVKLYQELFGDELRLLDYGDLNDVHLLGRVICDWLGIEGAAHTHMPTLNASSREERPRGLLRNVKRLIRRALAPRNETETMMRWEDGAYLFRLLEDDIRRCIADPSFPTRSWTCMKFAETANGKAA